MTAVARLRSRVTPEVVRRVDAEGWELVERLVAGGVLLDSRALLELNQWIAYRGLPAAVTYERMAQT